MTRDEHVHRSSEDTETPTFTDIPDICISVKIGVPVSLMLQCTLCEYSHYISEPLTEFSVIGLLKLLVPRFVTNLIRSGSSAKYNMHTKIEIN